MKDIQELIKKIEHLGFTDVTFVSLKEAGVNLGRLAHILGIGYLSGGKARNTAS